MVSSRALVILVVALALSGCRASTGGAATAATRRQADLITAEELARGQWTTAFEAVAALRPRWLSNRGHDSINSAPSEVQVRLDESWLGGLDNLRAIAVPGIIEMRFVDPITAGARWGGTHVAGAIVVVTRR